MMTLLASQQNSGIFAQRDINDFFRYYIYGHPNGDRRDDGWLFDIVYDGDNEYMDDEEPVDDIVLNYKKRTLILPCGKILVIVYCDLNGDWFLYQDDGNAI